MSKNDSIEIGAGISRSDADKYPDQIFLIDIGPGPDEGVVWCDCAAPGQDMDPDDAVVYVRIDTVAALQQPESEPKAVLCQEIGETTWFDHNPLPPDDPRVYVRQQSPQWETCTVYPGPQPSAQEIELDDVLAWADGIQGALGSELAARVTDREAVIATAIERAASGKASAQVPEGWEVALEVDDRENRIGVVNISGPSCYHMEMPVKYEMFSFFEALASSAPSIAEKREPAVSFGEKLFSFASKQDWINKAQRVWKKNQVRCEDTLCIDQLGRVCDMGQHFREAEEDNAYPINVYRRRPEQSETKS